MPRIKRSCIEDVRQRVSLVDVAGAYTQMKRAGAQFRGLSPFNPEKTPSFYIHPEKNVFMDYSSGNAGDLFRFIQLKENLNFQEAIESIAQRYGIQLDYEDDGTPPERISLRKELFELHEAAADYFHRCFKADKPEALAMREYWTGQRGFPIELADEFSIGFSPPDGAPFISFLQKKSFSIEALRESGLLYLRDYDKDLSRARARFRGRLMVPIRDVQGRIIAFTARVTEQTPKDDPSHEAKYINSPETPIFIKSHVLFGLERARRELSDGDPLVMVEGQLDCLRCWQVGIRNAVAPQGTAITEHQLSLARRYTGHLECLLDGDAAGQKAALRMLPLALSAGLEVSFLQLPERQDPDDLLRDGGKDALEGLRDKALSAMEFATKALLPEPEKAGARDKAEALDKIYAILRECDSAVARDAYLAEISRIVQVEPGAVRQDFAALRGEKAQAKLIGSTSGTRRGPENQKLTCVEGDLLSLFLHFPELSPKLTQVIDVEWINGNRQEGAILARLLSAQEAGECHGHENIEELLENDDEKNIIYRLLAESPKVEDLIDTANDCLRRLMSRFLAERKKTLEVAILNETDTERRQALFNERHHLRQLQASPPQLD